MLYLATDISYIRTRVCCQELSSTEVNFHDLQILKTQLYYCKNCLLKWPWVKVTAVSGFIEHVIKTQLSSINPLTIHQASKSTDTCLLTNEYPFICIHLLAIIRFWTTWGNCQQMDAMNWYRLACWQVSVLASSLKLDGIVRGWWMIIVFWNFFHHTTYLFNEPWNCSNHALVVN